MTSCSWIIKKREKNTLKFVQEAKILSKLDDGIQGFGAMPSSISYIKSRKENIGFVIPNKYILIIDNISAYAPIGTFQSEYGNIVAYSSPPNATVALQFMDRNPIKINQNEVS